MSHDKLDLSMGIVTIFSVMILASCSYVTTLDYSEPNVEGGIKNTKTVRIVEHAGDPFRTVYNSIKVVEQGVVINVTAEKTPVNADWMGPLVFSIIPIGIFREKEERLLLKVNISGMNAQVSPDKFIISDGTTEIKPYSIAGENQHCPVSKLHPIWR